MSRITVIVSVHAKAVTLFRVALPRCEANQVTYDGPVDMGPDHFAYNAPLSQDSVFSDAANFRICRIHISPIHLT